MKTPTERKEQAMSEQKTKITIDEAHNRALAASKQTPNRSDPFSYARIYSRIINGVYGEKDLRASNFSLSL